MLNLLKKSEKELIVGLAGPGAGKTFSFGKIIESEEYQNKKILILSFINKLVDDLAEKFAGYGNVEVMTLHSFAMQKYKKIIGSQVCIEPDLDEIISEDFSLINTNPISYMSKLHSGDLTDKEKTFYDNRSNYYKYKEKPYSFNSIIYAINRIYSEDTSKIPSDYELILIDEFQDFNLLEYNLINLLNQKNRVVLVGDDDQSLYDWKHAKPELIRELYKDSKVDKFSLDYCYRCTEVIVNAVNSLVKNAKSAGFLSDRMDEKKFLYPTERSDDKHEISSKYSRIDFVPNVSGYQLIYQLTKKIREDLADDLNGRVLVLVPSYLKFLIYQGLAGEGFNVVGYELFGNEACNSIKHKCLIDAFNTLAKRKTDNLALRKIIRLYLSDGELKELVSDGYEKGKKIWPNLGKEIQEKIEQDIDLFKKVRTGKLDLTSTELKRFSQLFNLKNLMSKMIDGFEPTIKGAIEIELTTVMSSKGLDVDFVYYVGIDNRYMHNKVGKLTNQKICEFLVGITRSKKKLSLFSTNEDDPEILSFIDAKHINRIKVNKD